MSEDSDYTSDINYPLRDQYNSSAHQYRSEHPYRAQREDSRDSQASRESEQYYSPSRDSDRYYSPPSGSFDRMPSLNGQNGDFNNERGYERERDYYNTYPESPYHPTRSDTDSEPLYYNSRPNSRPQSFMTDR